jgi:hypothetical protein
LRSAVRDADQESPDIDKEAKMCTMIAKQIKIEGSGKSTAVWFKLGEADVSYDHPFDAPFEHALNIDFVNESLGPGARVAVELSIESARVLVEAIQEVLEQAEKGGYVK